MSNGCGWISFTSSLALALLVSAVSQAEELPNRIRSAPERLSQTGLYLDIATGNVDPVNLKYSPQYPLWSDGAAKSRWISLPPGTKIDTTNPDSWDFPIGTRFWKEFSFSGKRVETRYLERVSESEWIFATYLWNGEQNEAKRAPVQGVKNYVQIIPGKRHDIPSVQDCKICHESPRTPPLGFNALQLSDDRDPGAIHGEPLSPDMIRLSTLIERKLLSPDRPEWQKTPPRIQASSPRTRSILGYFASNCGSCHNSQGDLASLELFLHYPLSTQGELDAPAFISSIGKASKYQIPGAPAGETLRIKPRDPSLSATRFRMNSRSAVPQMPPLGTKLVDTEAVELLTRWIDEDLK